MTELKPSTLWHVYHSLWGKAHDAPHYDKSAWNAVFREVEEVKYTTGDSALRRKVLGIALSQGVSDDDVDKFR